MKRPLSLLALSGLILSLCASSAFSDAALNASVGSATSESRYSDLERLLPGVWRADNCGICKFNVINHGGFLYADMADWGDYGRSYSMGYQPIDVISYDTFLYRGDYFQFYILGGNQFRIENISGGGDRNVSGATRLGYYPAPIPPRPIPRPYPRPYPPRPAPRPRPQPPRPQPPRPQPPRPQPPRPQPPRPQPPRPQPPRPIPPPTPPRPRPTVAPAPRPAPAPAPRPAPRPGPRHGG